MRRLYVEPAEFATDEVRITGPRARRLREVLRMRVGAELTVFDGSGLERAASVSAIRAGASGEVTLALGEQLTPAPEPPVPITLCCAFPRGSRGDWLVEKATEIGVAQLVPLEADRSVMHAGEGRIARWQRCRGGRAVWPSTHSALRWGAPDRCHADGGRSGYNSDCADAARCTVVRTLGDRVAHRPGGWMDARGTRGI